MLGLAECARLEVTLAGDDPLVNARHIPAAFWKRCGIEGFFSLFRQGKLHAAHKSSVLLPAPPVPAGAGDHCCPHCRRM